jgi:hypothetical protein
VSVSGSTERTLTGTIETTRWIGTGEGTNGCQPNDPDLEAGAPIRVTDPDGTLIGTSRLGEPYRFRPEGLDPFYSDSCVLAFEVTGLPDAAIYQVALASDLDQIVSFTRADLEDRNWSIQLTFN